MMDLFQGWFQPWLMAICGVMAAIAGYLLVKLADPLNQVAPSPWQFKLIFSLVVGIIGLLAWPVVFAGAVFLLAALITWFLVIMILTVDKLVGILRHLPPA